MILKTFSNNLRGRQIALILIPVLIAFLGSMKVAVAYEKYGIRGKIAPELDLQGWIDGNGRDRKPLKLSDLRGKIIYLYFFQAWCPGCQSHGFPTLKTLSERFGSNANVAFVAVQTVFEGFHFNTRAKLRESQLTYGIRVPMAHDAGTPGEDHLPTTMRRYRSGGTPWTVIIDHSGTVVYNQFHIEVEQATVMIQDLIQKRLIHLNEVEKDG